MYHLAHNALARHVPHAHGEVLFPGIASGDSHVSAIGAESEHVYRATMRQPGNFFPGRQFQYAGRLVGTADHQVFCIGAEDRRIDVPAESDLRELPPRECPPQSYRPIVACSREQAAIGTKPNDRHPT